MTQSPAPELKAPAIIRSAESTPGTSASAPWAIRMQGISKRYRLGGVRSLNDNIREDLMHKLGALLGRSGASKTQGTFWALKDIDLEINRGDTVGIIGRNGAGKSTLLKILSRITPPTEGTLRYRGRLASLLEVGTGFHRELTGRENIYLNGAILGMRRVEINSQFDAIVDFAGIETFLDTPVKFYSSGMYIRLAFAVAAHLRTEILVVDEVLAVGDAGFQKKCLGKMQDVATDGRTVLFVSHNIAAVESLCTRGVLVENGRVQFDGPVEETMRRYVESMGSLRSNEDLADRPRRETNGQARLCGMKTLDPETGAPAPAICGSDLKLEFEINSQVESPDVQVDCAFKRVDGLMLLHLSNATTHDQLRLSPGANRITLSVPRLALPPGLYPCNVMVRIKGEIADWVTDAWTLEVNGGDYYGTGTEPPQTHALFYAPHKWSRNDE